MQGWLQLSPMRCPQSCRDSPAVAPAPAVLSKVSCSLPQCQQSSPSSAMGAPCPDALIGTAPLSTALREAQPFSAHAESAPWAQHSIPQITNFSFIKPKPHFSGTQVDLALTTKCWVTQCQMPLSWGGCHHCKRAEAPGGCVVALGASLECFQPKPVMNCPWKHFLGPQPLQLLAMKLLL